MRLLTIKSMSLSSPAAAEQVIEVQSSRLGLSVRVVPRSGSPLLSHERLLWDLGAILARNQLHLLPRGRDVAGSNGI